MTSSLRDRHAVVSSDTDSLILVNAKDEQIGVADKAYCHNGDGVLHRAFSVLLFNQRGELLVQKRADQKRLWGGYWSNSCCSHPREHESMEHASQRRIWEELGLKATLIYLYKFEYHARYGDAGSEHELCSVFIGRCDETPKVNANEISDWRYLSANDVDKALASHTELYTPWFKLEWQRIHQEHQHTLETLFS